MDRINYHHLYYFWSIVREGGVAKAARRLRLAQPTLSGQIRVLEGQLGERLFERRGRQLALTEVGRVAFGYAEGIFTLGGELQTALKGRPTGRPMRLAVGVADVVPKLVAHRVLAPALAGPERIHLDVREDSHERLLGALAAHEIDLMLSDSPASPSSPVRAFAHVLGDTGADWFASPALARRLARGFPRSLHGAPVLLPPAGTAMRRSLDHWFERHHVRPEIVGQFDDSALTKVFGQHGLGVFPAPTIIAREVIRQYSVKRLGTADGVRERYHALTVERRLKHPAVQAITENARKDWFS